MHIITEVLWIRYIIFSKVTDYDIIRQLFYICCLFYGECKVDHDGWKTRNRHGSFGMIKISAKWMGNY